MSPSQEPAGPTVGGGFGEAGPFRGARPGLPRGEPSRGCEGKGARPGPGKASPAPGRGVSALGKPLTAPSPVLTEVGNVPPRPAAYLGRGPG